MKIVFLEKDAVSKGDISYERFDALGETTYYNNTKNDEINDRIKDADVVLCNKCALNSLTLSGCDKVKYIGIFATGYNNIDLKYTKSRGIVVTNVPDYSSGAVVQHTFALILELFSRVGRYNASVKAGDWIKSPVFCYFPFPTYELSGKTIGVIGYGSIGKRVCQAALAFGMNVLCCARKSRQADGIEFTDMDTLLRKSDIITLHCPLNEDTEKLINDEAFAKMKYGAVLINTARGPIVDETALYNALKSGRLYGAGLDVLENEPMKAECRLMKCENCIITPHIAWAPLETRERLIDIAYNNLVEYLNGKEVNRVE